MKFRSLFLIVVLAAIGGFTVLNWSVIMAPTTLSLGLSQVQAPLGLILLALMGLLIAVFLLYLVYLQTTVMFDARSHAKELQSNRKLADQAEASRFTELRGFLESELKNQAATDKALEAGLLVRLEQLEHDLRLAIEQSGNSLAATVAEMDDRLRAGGQR